MTRITDDFNYYSDTYKVTISDMFMNIYKNINVVTQVEKMKQLSKTELYLMLILCLDKFPDGEDTVVTYILSSFMDEMLEIKLFQETSETNNEHLKYLAEKTKDDYINTDNLFYNEELLPNPMTKEEVRNKKINIINNNEDGK